MSVKNQNTDKYRDEFISAGLKIGYVRRQKGMTQEQLSEKAGISIGYLSQIEAPNYFTTFSLSTLFALAEALQVQPSKLLEFD